MPCDGIIQPKGAFHPGKIQQHVDVLKKRIVNANSSNSTHRLVMTGIFHRLKMLIWDQISRITCCMGGVGCDPSLLKLEDDLAG